MSYAIRLIIIAFFAMLTTPPRFSFFAALDAFWRHYYAISLRCCHCHCRRHFRGYVDKPPTCRRHFDAIVCCTKMLRVITRTLATLIIAWLTVELLRRHIAYAKAAITLLPHTPALTRAIRLLRHWPRRHAIIPFFMDGRQPPWAASRHTDYRQIFAAVTVTGIIECQYGHRPRRTPCRHR